jgi:hypothetical protein
MDGFNPFDDIMEEEFEFFEGDPESLDIMEGNTNSNHLDWPCVPTMLSTK